MIVSIEVGRRLKTRITAGDYNKSRPFELNKLLDEQCDEGPVTIYTSEKKEVKVEQVADEGALHIRCLSPGEYTIKLKYRMFDSETNLYSKTVYTEFHKFSKGKAILIRHDEVKIPATIAITELVRVS